MISTLIYNNNTHGDIITCIDNLIDSFKREMGKKPDCIIADSNVLYIGDNLSLYNKENFEYVPADIVHKAPSHLIRNGVVIYFETSMFETEKHQITAYDI